MDKNYFNKVREAKEFIESKIKIKPEIMLVLSGGLTKFVEKIEDPVLISASDVINFPKATAEGHSGTMIFGKVNNIPMVAFQGRFHYYEGHRMSDIVFPLFTMNSLGAKKLILTNATGGINKSFSVGDIMLITDHINYMGSNPLIGIATQFPENQFPSMTEAYSLGLREVARKAAKEAKINLKEGVYIATSGPSYETKAEIKMFREWGADTVGMSVVPEVIAAKFLKMEVMGFSCIANPAADIHRGEMSHHEVLASMKGMEEKLVKLLSALFNHL